MAAKLATADDHILALMEEAGAIRGRSIISDRDKPQADSMQFDSGYLSPYFITDPERMEVAFENVYILIHEGKISSKKDMLPLLEQIRKIGRPLLIVAEDFGSEALAALVVNKLRGPLQVAAVRAPGLEDQRKSMLRDIALLTGGKVITEDLNIQLKNILLCDLGQARKITVDKNNTLVEGRAKYDQLYLPAPRAHSNAYIPPVESLRTSITPGTHGTLSA
jgi:chaperonin GroEL (HSP60 family)